MFAQAQEIIGIDYKIEPIAQAGSARMYTRIITNTESYILCESKDVKENECFLYLSQLFSKHQLPVANVLAISNDKSSYLLSDLGKESLLDRVLSEGHTEQVYELYRQCIRYLVRIQLKAEVDIDYSSLLVTEAFDAYSILADLNYFKYYFLDMHLNRYDKKALHKEFEILSQAHGAWSCLGFMYRDLQGRNIMVQNNTIAFIDYQGGMKGPIQYDVASLLWQAKAALPDQWRTELYSLYKSEVQKLRSFDEKSFDTEYQNIILVRLLQVLGAYGLRGLIEKKSHFISSIPMGLQNVKKWLEQYDLKQYPTLLQLLQELTQDNYIKQYS